MACRLGDAEGLCNCDVLCTTEVEVVFKVGSHKVYGGEGFLSSLAPCRKFCSSLQKKHLQIFICGYYSSFLCFIDVWRQLLSFFSEENGCQIHPQYKCCNLKKLFGWSFKLFSQFHFKQSYDVCYHYQLQGSCLLRGTFNWNKEPVFLYKLSFSCGEIAESVEHELQEPHSAHCHYSGVWSFFFWWSCGLSFFFNCFPTRFPLVLYQCGISHFICENCL